jgi:hypothetical protein
MDHCCVAYGFRARFMLNTAAEDFRYGIRDMVHSHIPSPSEEKLGKMCGVLERRHEAATQLAQ